MATDQGVTGKVSVFNGESFVATALSPESGKGRFPNSRILELAWCESGERGKKKLRRV